MINKPYFRTVRMLVNGSYGPRPTMYYISDPKYARNRTLFFHGFKSIEKDFNELVLYVELCDENRLTYSTRIYELYLRICTEIEANFKAILYENGYQAGSRNLSIKDYHKVNQSHFLSQYKAKFGRLWIGNMGYRQPFKDWDSGYKLKWYQDYNMVKHNRIENYKLANFENLTESFAALICLLSSQFLNIIDIEGSIVYETDGMYKEYTKTFSDYVNILMPQNINQNERYSIDWPVLSQQTDKFQKYQYV